MPFSLNLKKFQWFHEKLTDKYDFEIVSKDRIPDVYIRALSKTVNIKGIAGVTCPDLRGGWYVYLNYDLDSTTKRSLSTLVHEARHTIQFDNVADWMRYLADMKYRARIEAEAYSESLQMTFWQYGLKKAEVQYFSLRNSVRKLYRLDTESFEIFVERIETAIAHLRQNGRIPGLKTSVYAMDLMKGREV